MRPPLRLFFTPETRLEEELRGVAQRHQSIRIHQRGIMIWSTAAMVALALLGIRLTVEPFAPWIAPSLAITFLVSAGLQIWFIISDRVDLKAAARQIEHDHPELDAILRTATEQKTDAKGELNFMQKRLLNEALEHAYASLWAQKPRRQSRWLATAHGVAACAALGLAVTGLRFAAPFQLSWPSFWHTQTALASGIEISPGNVEIEKGTTVVVAARFNDAIPATANLIWRQSDGSSGRSLMARSLSDPVFVFTLSEVGVDTVYHVEYDDGSTENFSLTVFELPALVRADATLDYPAYTGLEQRKFVDTRRVSSVAGAELDYEFLVNRPLASAQLVAPDGTVVELAARDDSRTRFGVAYTLLESQRFKLELTDDQGRTDPDPTDIRIAVQPNARPELTIEFPRSDQRVSPLEELTLQSKVRDDFGLLDFGIAYSIGAAEPTYLSMAENASSKLESNFEHVLALEAYAVEVDELVTWFGWAEDYGPEGEVRRTTSDLFFAEVRALDEIFREGQNSSGQPPGGGGGGGPAGELLEIQRQISIAIWNLQKSDKPSPTYGEDVATLLIGQEQAQAQITELKQTIEDPRLQAAADQADDAMDDAIKHLTTARDETSLEPLQPAWSSAQLAFRSLLKLQPKETNVTQGSPGSGGSGGRNQSQLNQLRFRQEQDNYATQSEAEAPATPEEREQLNVLARLKELARRQNDLNQRLQELQTALAAAADEAEREEIRRELKRLEEEQRRMLAELDDTRQRVDQMQAGEQRAEANQQLEQTRQDMQQAGEELAQGNVSQALASGTRAQESLEQTGENLRENSSSLFSDEMRELRRQARELAEKQTELETEWDKAGDSGPSLDDSASRQALAEAVDTQRQRYDDLIERLRQASSDSEDAEPVLHRRLYDLLRQQGIGGTEQQLRTASELLQRGFVEQAQAEQAGVGRSLEQLREGVERAANSVLGDEGAESRFAQSELNELARQLRDEKAAHDSGEPGGDQPGPGDPNDSPESRLASRDRPGDQPGPGRGATPDESGPPGQSGEGNQPGDGESLSTMPGTSPSSSPNGQSPSPELAGNAPAESGPPGEGQPGRAPGSAPGEGQPGGQPGNTPGGQSGEQLSSASGGQAGEGQPGEGAPPPPNLMEQLAEALGTSFGGSGDAEGQGSGGPGPLTGENFAEWADRLRTIESLMEDPELRQRLAQARGRAEEMRRDWQREAAEPQWDLVETGIIRPLEDARAWLKQELARLDDPEVLQPIDRDPVPEKYAESVRKYYEALSAAESARSTPAGDR
jgi:hypothetical protein